MPLDIMGFGQTLILILPKTMWEWALLFGYLLLFFFLFLKDRSNFQLFTLRKLAGWLLLGVLALSVGLFSPLSFNSPVFSLAVGGETFPVSPFAAVPSLLAGLILGPAPALMVGMSAGLGQAIGQSQQLYDLFHFAFAAWIAARLFHVNYHGWFYDNLRKPVVSGTLSQSAIAFMTGFVLFVINTENGLLGGLDLALNTVQQQIVPMFFEGLAGGFIVALILLFKPDWQTGQLYIPNPDQSSIQRYFRKNVVLFGAVMLVCVITAVFFLSAFLSARSIFTEMAVQAYAATVQVTDLQTEMEESLLSFDIRDDLLDGSKVNKPALGRLYRTARHYDQVFVVDEEQKIAASFPSPESEYELTDKERAAVTKSLQEGIPGLIFDSGKDGAAGISVVVPVVGTVDNPSAAFIGRVKRSSLANSLKELSESNQSTGAILNLDGEPIVEVGSGVSSWSEALPLQVQSFILPEDFGGTILVGDSPIGARQLIYLAPAGTRNWRVAVSTPLGSLLKPGLILAVVLGAGLFLIAGLFYDRINTYSHDLSRSIADLTQVSRNIADDISLAPRRVIGRQDELGELSQAIDDMQRRLKKRLDDQSLLLSVSSESSASFDLTDSLPVVLHGALRGTGAAGARGMVLNPGGGQPVSFAEGPAAESMEVLDSKLISLMRQEEELVLSTLPSICEKLEIDPAGDMRIKALYALPLQVENKFLGFLAVGFRNQREFSEGDLAFLRYLAKQAAIQVQKSYLYTYAEGGRKRLTAILDSTSEAVIVTDPTARILRINRAMEQAFGVEAQRVVGRKVADVIHSPALIHALTSEEAGSRDLEIVGEDGCTYFANTSMIFSRERQALGRVAVLHDVTQLKEIDRLKTEFIDNVSHDLRTPLTVLSGYASALALADDLTPEQRDYTDNILRSVERMAELVEDLLDLGKIEAGVDILFEDVDIGPLLQEIAEEHWLYAHESGVRLGVRVGESLPLVCCDKVLVRRAVSNLLMNGFKYAPKSGNMTLAAERTGDELCISVRDRGPGIASEDQVCLFEKFYRVNRHGSGGIKGSGLGLAIVKSIAEKHGGRAWCKSAIGKGSTFYLSFPLENENCTQY